MFAMTFSRRWLAFLCLWLSAWPLLTGAVQPGDDKPVELHHHLAPPTAVALTLDACSGAYDQRLIELLVQHRVPATLFVTQRWLARNGQAVREILQHPDLFELENHGTHHVPAVVGPASQRLYGMKVQPDVEALRAEITGGTEAIKAATGRAPRYFRGAGAAYDSAGRQAIGALGLRIAGFSVNADAGATYPAKVVAQRLLTVKPGDVVIAHMNQPRKRHRRRFCQGTAELLRRGVNFVKLSQTMLVEP